MAQQGPGDALQAGVVETAPDGADGGPFQAPALPEQDVAGFVVEEHRLGQAQPAVTGEGPAPGEVVPSLGVDVADAADDFDVHRVSY
jgi:hypothetical protein